MQSENIKIENLIASQLGSTLKGFCSWLKENAKGKSLFFLSREGWTVGENYKVIYPNDNVSFIRTSRILLNGINIQSTEDILKEIKKPSLDTTISEFLNTRFSLTEEEIPKKILPIKDKVQKRKTIESIITSDNIFLELSHLIINRASQKRERVLKYYNEKFGNHKNIALVDIGYNGTFRKEISKLYPDKIFSGYYLGTLDKAGDQDFGYLFQNKKNNNENFNIENNVLFLEYLLSREEGTVLDIDNKNQPILDSSVLPENIIRIQSEILKNIKEYDTSISLDFILNPSIPLVNYFKDAYVEDMYRGNKKHHLINKQKWRFTSKQKRNFIKKSAWRNGAKTLIS